MNSSNLKYIFAFSLFFIFLTMNGVAAQDLNFPPANCKGINFDSPQMTSTSQVHSAISVADLNHDGIPDVILALQNSASIGVFLSNNDGSFQNERNFPAGNNQQGLAIADFNNDGELDVAVTSQADQKVSILHGDGTGNFSAPVSYTIAGTLSKIIAADFNGDGWIDLAVGSSDLYILLGSRTGFTTGPTFSMPGNITNISSADFNEDSFADIAVTYFSGSSDSNVGVFLNNGTGGFTQGITFTDTTRLAGIITKDFNNDGHIDIIAAGNPPSSSPAKLIVLLGNGNGTFNDLPLVNDISTFGGMASGDFNNDGKLDFATSYGAIYLGNGNGTFYYSSGLSPITFPTDIAAADFNGDGNLDLAQSNSWRSRLYTHMGTGDGKFPVPIGFTYTVSALHADAVAADFSGDGKLDVVTIDNQPSVRLKVQNDQGQLLDTGIGLYSSGTSTVTSSIRIATADFNQDGRPDLAFPVPVFNQVIVLLNQGNNEFLRVTLSSQGSAEVVQTGDFNNDNFSDLAVLNRNATYTIFLNNGSGGFTRVEDQRSFPFSNLTSMAVTDIDLDGNDDLIISRSSANLFIFKGLGNGTFATAETLLMPRVIYSVTATDFNDDGRPDLALTSTNFSTGSFIKVLNRIGGTFDINAYDVEGAASRAVVADFDRDGKKDVIVSGFGLGYNIAAFFAGDGFGLFSAPQHFETLGGIPFTTADFNGDGLPDYGSIGAIYINKALAEPCLNINDSTVTETNNGTSSADFTVSLSSAGTAPVSVNYRVVGRNAVPGQDIANATGTITFQPGELSKVIQIPVNGDLLDEADETFNVQLSQAVNASIKDGQGKGTILDNDEAPNVVISDTSTVEGSGGTSFLGFSVSLSAPSGRLTKVNFTTQNGTATAPSDYTSVSGVFALEPGVTTRPLVVPVNPDTLVEPDETLQVLLSNPVNLNITDGEAVGTIVNDDIGGVVEFSASAYEVNESAGTANITIQRTGGEASGITLEYLTTTGGTATPNQDYQSVSGTITFGANEHSKTFTIPIINDSRDEIPVETVNLLIRNIAGGASFGSQTTAVLNINDDDPAPQLSGNNVNVTEGNSGTVTANFLLQLSAPSDLNVSINFATADGTAHAPEDYQARTGTVTFLAGETSKIVSVLINGDTTAEQNETFFLNLSSPVNVTVQNSQLIATILNDDNANSQLKRFDFDGDGKTDISIFRPNGGEWWYRRSSDGQSPAAQFGSSSDIIVPADFTGDGKTDIAFFRPSTGYWYVVRSENSSYYGFPFGASGDIPAPGDYDGDGKTDAAVFRPSNASWYILRSSDGGVTSQQFGFSGDKPAVADYDGDGKTDIGIWRPNGGEWWYQKSSNGQVFAAQFGNSSDKPVQGDYTGDGKADIAFWRPSTGQWFILRSEDFSFYGFTFGANGDIPAPGDYDGDGKFDVTVFRPTGGTWYINGSNSGVIITNFGTSGDIPVPAAFIP